MMHCASLPGFVLEGQWTELNISLCQTAGVYNIALTNCRKNLGVLPPEKLLPQNFLLLVTFQRIRDLMANIFGKKHTSTDNRGTALGQRVPCTVPKFSELWFTNATNFYPSSVNSRYDYGASRTKWRRTASVYETIEIKSLPCCPQVPERF